MPVNGDTGHTSRRRQADRSGATRAALLAAGRELFTEQGYAGAGREEIAARAGVTRGALYHHFANKQDLFRAVVEDLEAEMLEQVATAAMAGADPGQQLVLGCRTFLDIATEPAVGRILLTDAPSVLGWAAWREIESRYGLGLTREALANAMAAGMIEAQPVEPLAHMLLAALNEAAMLIAQADDVAAARAEVGAAVERLLARL